MLLLTMIAREKKQLMCVIQGYYYIGGLICMYKRHQRADS